MIFKSELENGLKTWYKVLTGRDIDFQNLQTFNEKMQWCKLYDNNPLKTKLTDKYEAKRWVADKIGKEYIIDLIGVYENWEEVPFDELPEQFVIKATHGWAQNIIVQDKSNFDKNEAKLQIENWLNHNHYTNNWEMQYKDIKPRILIEKYLENYDNQLYDYKLWCFNGKVEYIMLLKDRTSDVTRMFFNREWECQSFTFNAEVKYSKIPKPVNLNKMIEIAEILSKGFNFVRVDLYCLNDGDIKFGEMTFTPDTGGARWNSYEAEFKIGQLLNIEPLKEKLINQYNNSKVIFFTPAYNAITTIERAYKSLLNQTDKNWIWHVVDDVSTDGTYELLQKFANKDERIMLHRNKVNNVIAEGNDIVDIGLMYDDIDYLAVLDADDEYKNDFISDCKTYAIANNLDIVAGGREDIVDNKCIAVKVAERQLLMFTKNDKERNFVESFNCMLTYWGKLFKINNFKKIDRSNLIHQHINGHDVAFSTELFKKATNIGIRNKAFYKYHIYPTSKARIWRSEKIDAYIKLYSLVENYLLYCKPAISERNEKFLQFICLQLIIVAVEILIKADLTDYEKQQEILKIGRADYIKCLIVDEGFDSWCNNVSEQKDIKKKCFTLIKNWMLSQTNIEDGITLEFCETGQLFCASMNDEEGWIKLRVLHANALIEIGNKMIIQGEQEIEELERMLNM